MNAIVGSFKPERSQSSEKRFRGTVLLAALQQALRTETTTSRRNSTSLQLARWDDLKLERRLATQASAVSARSNDVLERSEVVVFTMGQEAGSVSEPRERAPSAILFLPTGVSTDEQDLTAQRDTLAALGVDPGRIYVDHGLTGTNHERPGLRQAARCMPPRDARSC